MKKQLFTFTSVLIAFVFVSISNAAIVNINAKNNAANNPISILFEAGTYDIAPISIDDGGLYTAWSAHYGYANTWVHRYSYSSNEFGSINIGGTGSGPYYANADAAFEHAISSSFTLENPGYVNFYVFDGPNGYSYASDNVGGASLSIDAVPIPGALLLLLSGMVGLIGVKRINR